MRDVARMTRRELEELFTLTADKMKLSPAIIEKDFWVCWMLDYPWRHGRLRQIMWSGLTRQTGIRGFSVTQTRRFTLLSLNARSGRR